MKPAQCDWYRSFTATTALRCCLDAGHEGAHRDSVGIDGGLWAPVPDGWTWQGEDDVDAAAEDERIDNLIQGPAL